MELFTEKVSAPKVFKRTANKPSEPKSFFGFFTFGSNSQYGFTLIK